MRGLLLHIQSLLKKVAAPSLQGRAERGSSMLMGLMGLMGLIGLMGCSSEDERPAKGNSGEIEVMGVVTAFEEEESRTRAWEPPTGYTIYDYTDKIIGFYLTQDDREPTQGYFFNSSGKWRTSVDITAGDYYLYGYIPHSTSISCDISSSATPHDNSTYSNGAVMTLHNLPVVTPADYCVVIGAKNGRGNGYTESGDYEITGLRRGDFLYQAEAGEGNYVYLLFDHLYAVLRIHIKVHGDYDAIRTIKLKDLSLKTEKGDTPTKLKTDATITLTKTTDGSDPISSIVFTPVGDEEGEGSMFSSESGMTLTTEYSTFMSHFMPVGVTKLILTSVYDVYDKEGVLVREGCKATNTIEISKLLTGQTETRRGCRYTINMTIQPTYLYQLSDKDMNDFPVEISE